MSDAQVTVRAPDAMRALALFIATYVDRWPSLMSMHQAVLAHYPATNDEDILIQAIAPRLLAHLEQQGREATAQHDLMHYAVTQSALEQLRARSPGDTTSWHAFWQRLQSVTGEVRAVLEARYARQLQGEALAAHLKVAVADLPLLLCRTRSQVDGHASTGTWLNSDKLRMLSALIDEYLCGTIDPDSHQLLGVSLNRDFTNLGFFQRQCRMHLLLSAAFARLPFAPVRTATDSGSSRLVAVPNLVTAPRQHARKGSSSNLMSTTTNSDSSRVVVLPNLVSAPRQSARKGSSSNLMSTTTDSDSSRVVVLPNLVSAPRQSARKGSSSSLRAHHREPGPRSQHQSITWIVSGGCLLFAGLLVLVLNLSDRPVPSASNISAAQPPNGSSSAPHAAEVGGIGTPRPAAPSPLPALVGRQSPPNAIATPQAAAPTPSPSLTLPALSSSPPSSPSVSAPVVIDSRNGINLVNKIDLQRDVIAGEWQLIGETLRVKTENSTYARMEIPVARAREYDLRVVFTRVEGTGGITILSLYGNELFSTSISSYGNRIAGFSLVDGKGLDNPTHKKITGLVINGIRHTALIEVRHNEARLSLNGALLSTWTPALGPLSAHRFWALRVQSTLGLGCNNNTILHFHEVVYSPRD